MVNVNGYNSCKCTEKKIAKAAARLAHAFANADVPKVTVIAGQAFGTAGLVMNSKSIGSDIVYAWKNASIGMMEAVPAVKIMYAEEISGSDNAAALISEKAAQYSELQASAMLRPEEAMWMTSSMRLIQENAWIAAMEMLFTKREDRPAKKHGTV